MTHSRNRTPSGNIPQSGIEQLLARLDGVRRAGKGYIARCPAHRDRSPSLSIASGDDGRLLVHCHAGCSIYDVVSALGLTVSDLFPRTLASAHPSALADLKDLTRKADIEACANVLDGESRLVLIAASEISRGESLRDDDINRLAVAIDRIHAARTVIGPRR